MKDNLKDLIQHVQLDGVDLIKVTGTLEETKVAALAEDKSVIVFGTFKHPISDFDGIFGMPNLSKLKTILNFDDYNESSTINVTRVTKDEVVTPTSIHFETKDKSFINDYRLMAKTIVEEKVKAVTFKGVVWNIEFVPTVAGIQRLKKQASANSEESHFTATTVNGDLKINFGDPSTHSGNFVFQSGITGSLTRSWMWPVKQFLSIMDLPGDKILKISDKGAAEITVDSGIAVYQYLLPAQAK